ncbi:putative glyoxylate reductase [Bacteriovorax sp. BAL6_X]|uniref:2-hydroxyacid dehydrogenase n=1 Tax=Bacteriovorax sp. BAL6_X TaxID=1201290 RepID=UPI0003864A78|nr:D-glycerate dehydrogenase [Bacteriovorax sp. BAL6_X]EPZ51182.1 putative glyoxylate reductase [Bacteriovorax sp. BAL6_X]
MRHLKIFATDVIKGSLFEDLVKEGHQLTVWDRTQNGEISESDIINNAKECDVIISMLSNKLGARTLAQLPNIKLISQYAVGFNNIDINFCQENGISVTNTPNVLTNATAELAMALMLCSARNIEAARKNVIDKKWQTWEPSGFIGKSLFNLKHGIIGAGRIGTQFAKMCKGAFNQEIIYTGPNKKSEIEETCDAKYVNLQTLLQESDIISIHCPYSEATHQLINQSAFKRMKKDILLINTARGEIIDEEAMYHFFKINNHAMAGLDVVCNEPLDDNSPLRELDNIFILPHIGSANDVARSDMAQLIFDNIQCFANGKDLKTSV